MNERIKQISDQVWEWAENQEYSEPDQFSDIWETKFAELIVRECANICEDIADPTLYRNADYHSRMSPGASYAAKVIKLRFGVEE